MTFKNSLNLTLADRLKMIRENLEKSQKTMAADIGISFRAWQGYELGNNTPGSAVIEELVRLGYNANWILTGEGPMKTKKREYSNKDFEFQLLGGRKGTRLFNKLNRLISDHKGTDKDMSDDMSMKLFLTLFYMLYQQDESWHTKENLKQAIDSLLNMSKAFKIFRNLKVNEEGVEMLISFLIDPECWEFWQPKVAVLFDSDK